MSALVDVYVKPNCEKCINALSMVSEYGGIDRVFVVGDVDEKTKKSFSEQITTYEVDGIEYISKEKFGDGTLPHVEFDQSLSLNYEELVEAYDSQDLDQYFT